MVTMGALEGHCLSGSGASKVRTIGLMATVTLGNRGNGDDKNPFWHCRQKEAGPSLLQGTPALNSLELEQFHVTLALFSVCPHHDEWTGTAEAVLVFYGDATSFVFLKIGIVHGA